jgi:hypothetical protein
MCPLRGEKYPAGVAAAPPSNPIARTRARAQTGGAHANESPGLRAPDGLVHGEAGFGGSPCCLDDKQHAQRFACRIGRPRWPESL